MVLRTVVLERRGEEPSFFPSGDIMRWSYNPVKQELALFDILSGKTIAFTRALLVAAGWDARHEALATLPRSLR